MSGTMIYLGSGDWLPGLPARDLTAEEAESHRDALESPAGQRLYAPPGVLTSSTDDGAAIELQSIDGIGMRTAAALVEQGFGSLEFLAAADPAAVDAALDGLLQYVTVEKVSAWQERARELIGGMSNA